MRFRQYSNNAECTVIKFQYDSMKQHRKIADRSQLVVRVFIALLLVTLLTVYNNETYNIFANVRWQHLKPITKLIDSELANTTITTTKIATIATTTRPEGYLVWNENCHMPSFDPYERKYIEAEEDTRYMNPIPNCTEKQPLVSKSYNTTLQAYVLHIHTELKDEYLKGSNDTDYYYAYGNDGEEEEEDINCCYTPIFRDTDKGYAWSICTQFEQDFVVPIDTNYILIECNGTVNASTFYKDGMHFFQDREEIKERIHNNTGTARPFGILMFGIDTVSQFNFRRVMPSTFEYVRNDSWFELSGYNKIEDNTFPNIMAILSGLDLQKAEELCNYHDEGGMDNCTTFLFNLLRQQGFITAYSEDLIDISTFNYLKPGFKNPPTDYYHRPLLVAMEELLPIKKMSDEAYCIGPRRYAEVIYDFAVEFAERFLGQSIFGLFWTNSFSHNNWADPATMDNRMVQYFRHMDESGILDNNVVILFSDHGARWGFLRSQKEGYIEERLPMFFMRLPQWLKDENPEFVKALTLNQNRLTSPYDVHVTLKHLAMMSLGKNESIDLPLSCSTCQTLLATVLEDRTCSMAGIEDHWCTCTPFETLDKDSEEMANITQLVIDEMNNYLNRSVYADQCVPLLLKRVVEANLRLDLHQDVHYLPLQEYRMNFETSPNDALFDASFQHDKEQNTITIDVTEISRLNRYAEDSKCVDDNIVKKYCICKDSVKDDS
ncbi:uncharacterized protein LOC106092779 [Stomoxys calcitrans]|uniref:uncharacterized protein LOC106092779 n=1 Tax=Stomoxys calcitrans TaxID=35570 RepID=UPI0027E2B71B|nr:uncharacterized protein LOC106092779 [Stomoxys calcitrans]